MGSSDLKLVLFFPLIGIYLTFFWERESVLLLFILKFLLCFGVYGVFSGFVFCYFLFG